MRALALVAGLATVVGIAGAMACGGASIARDPIVEDRLAKRFPLTRLDDTSLCTQLRGRTPSKYEVWHDPEPHRRRRSS